MIIHQVNKRVTNDTITLTAKIEWDIPHPNLPESLWYSFPASCIDTISNDSDGFLIPLVSVAMFYNENIHVQGSVSGTLLYALDTYQAILSFWHDEFFCPINITADTNSEPKTTTSKGTMCTYTGGVDSSFTLWSHLPQNEKLCEYNITHALYITEFGLQSENQATILAKSQSFSALVRSLGIKFIEVETNAKKFQQFGHQTPMYMSDASLILGPAAFFNLTVSNFLFSSDATHDFEILEIINHSLVPLLASGNMNVQVHGASVTRLEKLRALSHWPAIHNQLVSCWKNPNKLKNCGSCYKCCYTMAAIELENLTGVFKTYPLKIDRSSMRACRAEKGLTFILKKWSYIAWQRGKWAIFIDYTCALWVSRLHILLDDLGLSSVRKPISILYMISAVFRKKSPRYSIFINRIKSLKI